MSEPQFFHQGDLVAVLTSQPLDRVLDYKAPEGGCWQGAFVEVPLGPRKVLGVVWRAGAGDYDHAKIRSVIRVLDVAPMQQSMAEFLRRVSEYTLTPMSKMLRLATRAPGFGDPPSMRQVYRLGAQTEARMTDARQKVLAVLEEFAELSFTLKELSDAAGVTSSVVKGLVKLGAVEELATPQDMPFAHLNPSLPGKSLSEDQAAAVAQLQANSAGYRTTLLKGVTGSGRRVNLHLMAHCRDQCFTYFCVDIWDIS